MELDTNKNNDLIKAKELCELKILELRNNQDNKEFKKAFLDYIKLSTFLTLSNFDIKTEEGICEIIKIIAYGYLADNSHFVKDFLNKQRQKIENIEYPDKWNIRLLTKIFKAIFYLITNNSRNDIIQAIELINQLREEQKKYEENYLNQLDVENRFYVAAELISLYYFAGIAEILCKYLLEDKTTKNDVEDKIKYHFMIAKEFANASGNIILELLYQYFELFSIKFIEDN